MASGGQFEDNEASQDFIVKLRGLPWSATCDDVISFFKDCTIRNGSQGIHLTSSREGRPSGEGFVELETFGDLETALSKDREHLGSRYIEVFKANRDEMDWILKRSDPHQEQKDDGCVRLRGLPFDCSKEEIAQFFTGLEIVPNGITLLTDYTGRSSGEGFVQFLNNEVAEKALLKHREKIAHRYIEVFRSSLSEVHSAMNVSNNRRGGGGFNNRPTPYERNDRFGGNNNRFQGRPSRNFKGSNFSNSNSDFNNFDRSPWMNNSNNGMGYGDSFNNKNNSGYQIDSWGGNQNNDQRSIGSGYSVHMRGLPFRASTGDVSDFFKPIIPVSIVLLKDHDGRASGEADVEFASNEDALRAMSKDKCYMQNRYIELFSNSSGNAGYGKKKGPFNANNWNI